MWPYKPLFIEDVLFILPHPQLQRLVLGIRFHGLQGSNCCDSLTLVDVPGAKEELPVEVALLDVHVGHLDLAPLLTVTAQSHQGKVLE